MRTSWTNPEEEFRGNAGVTHKKCKCDKKHFDWLFSLYRRQLSHTCVWSQEAWGGSRWAVCGNNKYPQIFWKINRIRKFRHTIQSSFCLLPSVKKNPPNLLESLIDKPFCSFRFQISIKKNKCGRLTPFWQGERSDLINAISLQQPWLIFVYYTKQIFAWYCRFQSFALSLATFRTQIIIISTYELDRPL